MIGNIEHHAIKYGPFISVFGGSREWNELHLSRTEPQRIRNAFSSFFLEMENNRLIGPDAQPAKLHN